MIDLEKRLRRTFSSMAANESVADSLDEESASAMLKWGEVIAKQLVLKTSAMNDDEADEYLAPFASALRKMMRAMGQWVIANDEDARFDWWNRIEQNGKTLYGDGFVLSEMDDAQAQLQEGSEVVSVIAYLQNLIETQKAKG